MTYRSVAAPARSTGPVSRREFLTLRVTGRRRILELSCERLYMRYNDARSRARLRQISNHDDVGLSVPAVSDVIGNSRSMTIELFEELDRQLETADEIRIFEKDWLGRGEFGDEVGARIEAFRRRGGCVEYGESFSVPLAGPGG